MAVVDVRCTEVWTELRKIKKDTWERKTDLYTDLVGSDGAI